MNKIIVVLILLAIVSPVFAQNDSGDMYYQNVAIEKIYFSGPGYIIQYRKGINELGTIGVPYAWFTEAGGKAEILHLPSGANWPSMSVFYRDGEFSYVRLYVHRWKGHPTWAVAPMGADVSRFFRDPEVFRIEY